MPPQPGVKFLYLFCNDLHTMRNFYSDLLGLNEIYYSEMPDRTVAYDCDGLQFTIIFNAAAQKASPGWAWQPGWQTGSNPIISWSIVLTDGVFQTAVQNLKGASVETFYEEPQWQNYWSFPVKDPMGNTVEIVLASEEEPKNSDL
ncbi:MAG: hypothetical protein DWQ04_10245 [Chloroflexi bacterium]|nr:MAG: hypothetical protein DWQ04_10245 [Chloroflexota bacterium]